MKLRNKKTGKVVEDGYVRETHDFQFDGQKHVLAVFKGNGHRPPERVSGAYTSLAELNEEWEDYEEPKPKEYWFIDDIGEVEVIEEDESEETEGAKQIGNYFETKEEAEKAVQKLKAWKRLKDKGFRFEDWEWKTQKIDYQLDYTVLSEEGEKEADQDLDLLFSEEEE